MIAAATTGLTNAPAEATSGEILLLVVAGVLTVITATVVITFLVRQQRRGDQ